MGLFHTALRRFGSTGMAAFGVAAGCVALTGLGIVVLSGPLKLVATPAQALKAQTPELAVRASPLVLRKSHRTEVSLPADRLSTALLPVVNHEYLRWNQLVHGLRLWGSDADGNGQLAGMKLLDVVCSAEQSQKCFGFAPHVVNRNGLHFVQFLERDQHLGEKHLDETLSVLAEIGVGSDHRISLFDQVTTVSAALSAAVSNFVLDQDLDFSAVAFALYLPPQKSWTNKFGQSASFDDLCLRLCARPMGQGYCHGCHSMNALAVILAADKQSALLSTVVREKARSKLADAVATLRNSQRDDGTWDAHWFEPTKLPIFEDESDSLAVTGHTLEWLAVAPEEFVDDPKMISDACEGLLALFLASPSGALREKYNACTHAASAIKIWSPHAWQLALTGMPPGQ